MTATVDVLQVITTTDHRGAEVAAVELGDALGRSGRVVRTVALVPSRSGDGLDVAALGTRRLGLRTLRALRAEARRSSVVIAHGSTTLPACALACAGIGVPFVYRTIGDLRHWQGNRLRRLRSTLLLRRARAVVALTPGATRDLMDRYHVPADRISVIPMAVPARNFPPVDESDQRRARQELGLADGDIVVYLGSLSREKNVGLAIDAVAALPGVHLLIAGDGPTRPDLETRASRVAPDRVHFTGVTENPRRTLAAGDVVVLPSTTEGLPLVLIEAGLSGLPAVATDVGFVREIVVDGETGRLVPANDPESLSAALVDAIEHGRRFGAAARSRCLERFEVGRVTRAWEDLLDEISRATHVQEAR